MVIMETQAVLHQMENMLQVQGQQQFSPRTFAPTTTEPHLARNTQPTLPTQETINHGNHASNNGNTRGDEIIGENNGNYEHACTSRGAPMFITLLACVSRETKTNLVEKRMKPFRDISIITRQHHKVTLLLKRNECSTFTTYFEVIFFASTIRKSQGEYLKFLLLFKNF